jgi:hypothetical protein
MMQRRYALTAVTKPKGPGAATSAAPVDRLQAVARSFKRVSGEKEL